MNRYLLTLFLAIVWMAVTGSFAPINFLLGMVLGFVALALIRKGAGLSGHLRFTWRVVPLGLLFFYELVVSAWRVAILVLSPRMDLKPGILAYPLSVQGDFRITLLANLITLTPGTLSVDVSADRRTLYVHALDCSDPEKTRREVAEGFERKIIEAFP